MDERTREEILLKLSQILKLTAEVRAVSGTPAIEAFMRWSEMYAKWAQWFLAGEDRFSWEVDQAG